MIPIIIVVAVIIMVDTSTLEKAPFILDHGKRKRERLEAMLLFQGIMTQ